MKTCRNQYLRVHQPLAKNEKKRHLEKKTNVQIGIVDSAAYPEKIPVALGEKNPIIITSPGKLEKQAFVEVRFDSRFSILDSQLSLLRGS